MTIYDIIGLCGVSLSIYCYARLQWQRDYAKRFAYSAFNFLASLLYLISLFHNYNLPAVVSNFVWGALSLYGVYRCLKYMRREQIERQHVEPQPS